MKIRLEQLSARLKQSLAPVYCVHGDEPLLVEEAADHIRQAAQQHGFAERQRLSLEQSGAWQTFQSSYYEQSLFADQVLLEGRLDRGRVGTEGGKILRHCFSTPLANKCVLLIGAKFDGQVQSSQWMKSLDQAGIIVHIVKLTQQQYPKWLQQRAQQQHRTLNHEAALCLAELAEGNLLAANQELTKLCLFSSDHEITREHVLEQVSAARQITVFALVDAILAGQLDRVLSLFAQLQSEQLEPALLLWALTKQCRECLQMTMAMTRGHDVGQVLQSFHVWGSRKPLIQKALQHSTPQQWQASLASAHEADKVIKGVQSGDAWHLLQSLAVKMCTPKMACFYG